LGLVSTVYLEHWQVSQKNRKMNVVALGRVGSALGRVGSALGRVGSALGREGSALSRVGSALGREGSALGRVGSAPGVKYSLELILHFPNTFLVFNVLLVHFCL
jgi:hypothetical protein